MAERLVLPRMAACCQAKRCWHGYFKFTYEFDDEEFGHSKNVEIELAHEAVNLQDVCEMFEEFITSSGFSLDGVLRYFKS